MWLITYYPVKPHQEFDVYNVSSCDPDNYKESHAACALNQYLFARDNLYIHLGRPVPKIIAWNNKWFMMSEKDSLKQAIEEFWECFFKRLEGEVEYEEIKEGT